MKKFGKSMLCMIIAIAIMLTAFPMTVFAGTESLRKVDFSRPDAVSEINTVTYKKDPTLRNPKNYYTQPEPEGTLVAADEYSKTYQTSVTEFVTQIGDQSNTYTDSDGNVQLVDNTLVEKNPWFSADYFENTANDYTVKLPTEITNSNGLKLVKDGYTIELIPQDGDFSKPVVADNAVLYNDVFDGIDYQYTVLGDTVKEDIVLNKAVSMNEFSFIVKAGKLHIREKDGAIILYADNEDQPSY